jgi:hypothetical protein
MDLLDELDRLTEPQFVKATARTLSREEIEQLQAEGKITPPALIPARHMRSRVCVPDRSSNNSDYLKRIRNRMRYV